MEIKEGQRSSAVGGGSKRCPSVPVVAAELTVQLQFGRCLLLREPPPPPRPSHAVNAVRDLPPGGSVGACGGGGVDASLPLPPSLLGNDRLTNDKEQ